MQALAGWKSRTPRLMEMLRDHERLGTSVEFYLYKHRNQTPRVFILVFKRLEIVLCSQSSTKRFEKITSV
jgi:hypothetical protein